ncbi:MAG: SUMF1/EgtB/PvdO family nonheme iron enzyme, partial [Anaerolineales bacterium]|nr:SUMF1/EgtB/PvdO family nonheme iron enzyme [Anaerolineales bacterium]
DMSGNVWEWTRSLFESYPNQADDGRENMAADGSRVVRGGSWRNFQVFARAAFRGYDVPDARLDVNGFRVVVVRFSPSHQGH